MDGALRQTPPHQVGLGGWAQIVVPEISFISQFGLSQL